MQSRSHAEEAHLIRNPKANVSVCYLGPCKYIFPLAGLRSLNEAKAVATRQTDLTDSKVQIAIEVNQADAAAQRAQKDAQRNITIAEVDARQVVLRTEADSKQTVLKAQGESERTVLLANAEAESKARVAIAEALGIREVRKAYGSSELMVKQKLIGQLADALRETKNPLVPRSIVTIGGAMDRTAARMATATEAAAITCLRRCSRFFLPISSGWPTSARMTMTIWGPKRKPTCRRSWRT